MNPSLSLTLAQRILFTNEDVEKNRAENWGRLPMDIRSSITFDCKSCRSDAYTPWSNLTHQQKNEILEHVQGLKFLASRLRAFK
ncbi:MAG: hypothetical protein COB04_18735 [Gammaproteobacteria bacterium]|nr:MAG: hypothetical protein COB04_18735 [Gammaproteobacteria bacterium]